MISMPWRNILAGAGLLAFSAWYAWLAGGLPERSLPNTPGPSFFPFVIISLVALLSLALLIKGILTRQTEPEAAKTEAANRAMAPALAAFLLYLAALPFAGFIAASVVFFAVLMWLYGCRNPLFVAIGSISVPVVLFAIFRHGFQIVLPAGLLSF